MAPGVGQLDGLLGGLCATDIDAVLKRHLVADQVLRLDERLRLARHDIRPQPGRAPLGPRRHATAAAARLPDPHHLAAGLSRGGVGLRGRETAAGRCHAAEGLAEEELRRLRPTEELLGLVVGDELAVELVDIPPHQPASTEALVAGLPRQGRVGRVLVVAHDRDLPLPRPLPVRERGDHRDLVGRAHPVPEPLLKIPQSPACRRPRGRDTERREGGGRSQPALQLAGARREQLDARPRPPGDAVLLRLAARVRRRLLRPLAPGQLLDLLLEGREGAGALDRRPHRGADHRRQVRRGRGRLDACELRRRAPGARGLAALQQRRLRRGVGLDLPTYVARGLLEQPLDSTPQLARGRGRELPLRRRCPASHRLGVARHLLVEHLRGAQPQRTCEPVAHPRCKHERGRRDACLHRRDAEACALRLLDREAVGCGGACHPLAAEVPADLLEVAARELGH